MAKLERSLKMFSSTFRKDEWGPFARWSGLVPEEPEEEVNLDRELGIGGGGL